MKGHRFSAPGPVKAPGGETIEGGVSCSPARCYGVEGESQAARHARFVSADLDRTRIVHPRSQACETCGRTAPAWLSGSALVLGALIATIVKLPQRAIAAVMALRAGG
ncbi:hypothetical protein JH26_13825 [Microvirga sp. BSC39]|nr:hypothetical protein JH26_13825 [Microvirga sp. BSC39]